MSGAFRVYQDREDPRDIHFELALKSGEVLPPEQADLRDSVDASLTTIRLLFVKEESKFQQYFRPLLALAQLGLVGDTAAPALAQRALQSLKNEILAREGGVIKNEYMKRLGRLAAAFGGPPLAAALVMRELFGQSTIAAFLVLWAGCMAGVWLSFGSRKVVMSFEELAILESDRLSPAIRLAFAGALTSVIGLLIATNAIVLQLGGLSTAAFVTDYKVALLIGVLCGISELALSSKVSGKAKEWLQVQ